MSDWARLVTLMAGPERGAFFRPEVGDEVLVAHEFRDPRRPYVLGSVWSSADVPPPDDGDAEANNWRFIRSRAGHIVKLNDKSGQETIEIEDKDRARRIVIDAANGKIRVECDDGDIEVTASGTVKVVADTVEVEASTVSVKASGEMTLEAAGTMTIKGSTVNIN
jgi:uncharacterized protein involved in type VI secretion and phage assembly